MPNTNLVNNNSPHSIRTRGHMFPLFQMPLKMDPWDITAGQSLKAAVGTAAGKFLHCHTYGSVQLLALGIYPVAALGAQTTDGSLKLYVGGAPVQDVEGNDYELFLPADTPIYQPLELPLNRTTPETNLDAEPDYPLWLADQLLEVRVGTQGAGAGDQLVLPYIIYRVSPRNRQEYDG